MSNLKETAEAYEPKTTLNIADLDRVDLKWPVELQEKEDKDGKIYTQSIMTVNNIDYRVPDVVLGKIQEMLELKPDLQFVKVEKTGSGVATRYTVKVAK